MKTAFIATVLSASFFPYFCFAAPSATSYQVTGPVVSVDSGKIVVKKGKETFEINRTPDTKAVGGTIDQIKPGAKVTIQYTMTASSVEIKAEKSGKVPATTGTAPVSSGTTAVPKK